MVHVQMGIEEVALTFRRAAPVNVAVYPTRTSIPLQCVACNVWCRAEAPMSLKYVDDEHYAYTDFGYVSQPRCACAGCGVCLRVALQFTLTRHRGGPGSAELQWDEIEEQAG